jgi:hypothetical protein
MMRRDPQLTLHIDDLDVKNIALDCPFDSVGVTRQLNGQASVERRVQKLHAKHNDGRVTPPSLASPVALVLPPKGGGTRMGASRAKLSRPADLKSRIAHGGG